MSATYRQSSAATPEKQADDPENKLLARGPRFRVESELLRDIVLRSSGLLSAKIGGPSVFPPQPPGITEAAYGALAWKVSEGEDRYRRGLYTFNKRTAPYAAFGLFDGPSGEVCIPRRNRSNTPLQSLALLNDEVVLEAARHMAGESLQTFGDDDMELATDLFRRCVTRPPDQDELSSILAYYRKLLHRFQSEEANPHLVLRTGPRHSWQFDNDVDGWAARNQCELQFSDGKLIVTCKGNDPFIGVKHSSLPGPYTLQIHARFQEKGTGEVFWTTSSNLKESALRSASFMIKPDTWHEYKVSFETHDELVSLRIDVGESGGVVEIQEIALEYGDGLYELSDVQDVNRLAAWMLTARALLNLDETITKS